jgi:hypothetical protein
MMFDAYGLTANEATGSTLMKTKASIRLLFFNAIEDKNEKTNNKSLKRNRAR